MHCTGTALNIRLDPNIRRRNAATFIQQLSPSAVVQGHGHHHQRNLTAAARTPPRGRRPHSRRVPTSPPRCPPT
uniref:Uncharacterized protein n=1 Tax=Arundo donax TaxID=35708 RepID=A0A0A9GH34_ARUDO